MLPKRRQRRQQPRTTPSVRAVACGISLLVVAVVGIVRVWNPRTLSNHHRPIQCYNPTFSIGAHRAQSGTIDVGSSSMHAHDTAALMLRPSEDTCRQSLQELLSHTVQGILDVDVVWYEGDLFVAHPAELPMTTNYNNTGMLAPSPCSMIRLASFLSLLQEVFASSNYYVTLEPKAAWEGSRNSNNLAPPSDIVPALLHTVATAAALRTTSTTDDQPWCGFILSPDQLRELEALGIDTESSACQLVLPLRRTDSNLWQTEAAVASSAYALALPTLELFLGAETEQNRRVLRATTIPTIVWIVDTPEALLAAVSLPGITGVVSNHPVQLQQWYHDLCSAATTPAP